MVKNAFLRRIACAVLVTALLPLVGGRPAMGQSPRAGTPQAGETVKATWTLIPGRAKDLSINAAAMAYAVGNDGVALRWRAVSQKWARMSGAFVRITAAEGNRPWGVTPDGNVMRFNGLWWEPKGDKVADVAGDAVGNIYIARLTGAVERWEPLSQSWKPVPGQLARRIALDIRGKPWIVTPTGQIMRWEDGAWISMPGIARDIALGADGSAVIVDGSGQLRKLRMSPVRWVPYEGVADVVAAGLTPNGGPWVTLADGRILATVLIRDQVPLTEEEEKDKAQTPHATVPQAPLAQAKPIIAPQITASAVQATTNTASESTAPDAKADTPTAQSLGTSGSGSGSSGGNSNSNSKSVSTGGGGGGSSDPAASTTKEELEFVDTRGTAQQIAIGRDGSVFALDTSGGITRWSNARGAFESFPGQLARIAVDSQGNPWGVTSLGRVFQHDGTAWVQVQGITASDISIGGKDDIVLFANADGILSRLDKATGRATNLPGLGIQVAAGPDGTPWVITKDQIAQRCDKSPCSALFQLARSIAVGPDGTVFLVNTNDLLMRKRPSDKKFSQVLVPGHTPASVAVGPNGFPWVVTSARKVLSTRYFERNETDDRVLALKSSGDTTGSGATAGVVSSQSSSAFTFTKNLKFDKYQSSDAEANMSMLSDVHAGHTGAVYISGDTGVFKFNTKTKKFEALDKAFSNSSLADVGEDESGTLWALSQISPARVYRLKGTQEKTYYVINSTDTNTPRNMAVAADGTVYVAVGAQLYKMEAGKSVFKQIESSDIFYVHLGAGGDLWILNQNSRVQQYTGSKFENRPKGTALQAQDMAVGADGSVYAIDHSTNLLKKWNASNGRFDDVNITQQMHRVTVTIEGRPWLAYTSGALAGGDIWQAKD
ncbi:MAG: tectonin domain-containing protein [Rhodospirillales bacterium]